jgi:ribosome biogenesis GTPase
VEEGTEPRPTVGDWVLLEPTEDPDVALIHGMLPRRTTIVRKVVGRDSSLQVIAANVDVVFIATSVGPDCNVPRLERYLALVRESGAEPVFVLTKADDGGAGHGAQVAEVRRMAGACPVVVTSSMTGDGLSELEAYFQPNRTVAIVGSSGIGKSTLVNRWLGEARQAVRAIREDGKGRHTTTHRALFSRPGGGLIMDTPGMREVGLWESQEGVRQTFEDLEALAQGCRFRDCRHGSEPGCALRQGVAEGRVDVERLERFVALLREGPKALGPSSPSPPVRGRESRAPSAGPGRGRPRGGPMVSKGKPRPR